MVELDAPLVVPIAHTAPRRTAGGDGRNSKQPSHRGRTFCYYEQQHYQGNSVAPRNNLHRLPRHHLPRGGISNAAARYSASNTAHAAGYSPSTNHNSITAIYLHGSCPRYGRRDKFSDLQDTHADAHGYQDVGSKPGATVANDSPKPPTRDNINPWMESDDM